jgi:hypothetical protein
MKVLLNVFFSAENPKTELKISKKDATKESNPVAADGKTKSKVTAFTAKAFATFIQENSDKLEGIKLKLKGSISKEDQATILNALDTLPQGTLYEVAFKKVHPTKEKKSCKFPFDVEAHKDFVAELTKRIKE